MTNRSDVVSSGRNLNNHRMEKTPMHRAVKTAVVALAALAVGACAGRQLHVAVVPEPALAQQPAVLMPSFGSNSKPKPPPLSPLFSKLRRLVNFKLPIK